MNTMNTIHRNFRWELEHGFRHDVVGGIGLAMQTIGGFYKAGAQKQAAEYNASVAQSQAQAARIDAKFRADRMRERTRRIQGAARAAIGASGITQGGSPGFVLRDNAIEAAMDELAVLRSGESRAQGYESEAFMQRRIADNALGSALFFAGGTAASYASRMDWGESDNNGTNLLETNTGT